MHFWCEIAVPETGRLKLKGYALCIAPGKLGSQLPLAILNVRPLLLCAAGKMPHGSVLLLSLHLWAIDRFSCVNNLKYFWVSIHWTSDFMRCCKRGCQKCCSSWGTVLLQLEEIKWTFCLFRETVDSFVVLSQRLLWAGCSSRLQMWTLVQTVN